VMQDTKYCTIIIQHALHKATAKLTRSSRAPRLANSRPSSLQFLQANAVMAAHPALLVVDSKPRTVHRDAAISKFTKSIHQSTNLMEPYCNSS
jgi:hypothetical protein